MQKIIKLFILFATKVGERSLIEKIRIELVPDSQMGISLKNGLKPSDWNKLRQVAIKKSNNCCACCGKKLTRFEAHEVWSYNEKAKTRKLENIIAVCSLCHKAIHMNRSFTCENIELVEDHYMKVNNASYSEMKKALKDANERQKELSKIYDWQLDFSSLNEYMK